MKKIEHLVFEGGGILGLAYSGAIEALEEQGILNQVKGTAGTSVGSYTAMALSLGYNAAEIKSMLSGMNFETFKDHEDILRIPLTYGLYKGKELHRWIQQTVAHKMGSENATFADLNAAGCKELKVYACDLNLKIAREFSYKETPDAIVSEAVRASMSIPFYFEAWQFSNSVPNNHIYVDGGTIYNYPIYAYPVESTLGFSFDVIGAPVNTGLKTDHLFKYIEVLFETMLSAQKVNFQNNPIEQERTVLINPHGISATDFALTDSQKETLHASGKSSTTQFIKTARTEGNL